MWTIYVTINDETTECQLDNVHEALRFIAQAMRTVCFTHLGWSARDQVINITLAQPPKHGFFVNKAILCLAKINKRQND